MSAFVDTNILVRHLTGDPPVMGKRATAYLAEADELYLTDLIAAETVYVLGSFYDVARARVAEAMRSLIGFDSMVTVDPALLLRAIEIYRDRPTRLRRGLPRRLRGEHRRREGRVLRPVDRPSRDRRSDRTAGAVEVAGQARGSADSGGLRLLDVDLRMTGEQSPQVAGVGGEDHAGAGLGRVCRDDRVDTARCRAGALASGSEAQVPSTACRSPRWSRRLRLDPRPGCTGASSVAPRWLRQGPRSG
ncbi:MAG: PIN domain-containing protein [Acidimicrobiia bacterium]|nr:PIN domain-containing protein [Acidimicrobiia bacterium]